MSDSHGGETPASPPVVLAIGRHAPDDPGPIEPSAHLDTVETATRRCRHDGWTPALRVTFLETLAESGVVTDACRAADRSSQTAYALRNRDPLFAAGWDAALSMARARLADELFHRSVNGSVEQVWKDGAIVAERHRHDNRLGMSVLNRLDARADRADLVRSPSRRLAAQWDQYLAAVADERTADIEALMAEPPSPGDWDEGETDTVLLHQFHQLRRGLALDEQPDDEPEQEDEEARIWPEGGTWRTDFPPPDGFSGDENGFYGDPGYDRQCTVEEREILDRRYPGTFVDLYRNQLKADEAERDALFAELAAETVSDAEPPAEPPPVPATPG